MAVQNPGDYPLVYDVEYPEEAQDRLKAFFRIFLAIPIFVVVATLQSGRQGGFLILGPALMIIFRQKYPRWWFDFNLEFARFEARVNAYFGLLREEYPATDDEQAVTLDIDYPDAENDLNQWAPIYKWILAIPHYVVLFFLYIAALVVLIVAWFAILITGHYPRGLFDFSVGVARWTYRVGTYAFLLTTDRYPPFSLK